MKKKLVGMFVGLLYCLMPVFSALAQPYQNALSGAFTSTYRGALSPDGRYLAISGIPKKTFVIDLSTHTTVNKFSHDSDPRGVMFSTDGTKLYTVDSYGAMEVFSLPQGSRNNLIGKGAGNVAVVRTYEQGKSFSVLRSSPDQIDITDVSGKIDRTLKSPDGKWMGAFGVFPELDLHAIGTGNDKIFLSKISDGSAVRTINSYANNVVYGKVTQRFYWTTYSKKTISFQPLAGGNITSVRTQDNVYPLAVHPSGMWVLTGGVGIVAHDAVTLRAVKHFKPVDLGDCSDILFIDDERFVAVFKKGYVVLTMADMADGGLIVDSPITQTHSEGTATPAVQTTTPSAANTTSSAVSTLQPKIPTRKLPSTSPFVLTRFDRARASLSLDLGEAGQLHFEPGSTTASARVIRLDSDGKIVFNRTISNKMTDGKASALVLEGGKSVFVAFEKNIRCDDKVTGLILDLATGETKFSFIENQYKSFQRAQYLRSSNTLVVGLTWFGDPYLHVVDVSTYKKIYSGSNTFLGQFYGRLLLAAPGKSGYSLNWVDPSSGTTAEEKRIKLNKAWTLAPGFDDGEQSYLAIEKKPGEGISYYPLDARSGKLSSKPEGVTIRTDGTKVEGLTVTTRTPGSSETGLRSFGHKTIPAKLEPMKEPYSNAEIFKFFADGESWFYASADSAWDGRGSLVADVKRQSGPDLQDLYENGPFHKKGVMIDDMGIADFLTFINTLKLAPAQQQFFERTYVLDYYRRQGKDSAAATNEVRKELVGHPAWVGKIISGEFWVGPPRLSDMPSNIMDALSETQGLKLLSRFMRKVSTSKSVFDNFTLYELLKLDRLSVSAALRWPQNDSLKAWQRQRDLITAAVNSSNPLREFKARPQVTVENGFHQSILSKVRWSPDGKEVVTASWDKTIRVWDAETGKLRRVFHIPGETSLQGAVYAMDISKNGAFLVAAGYTMGAGGETWKYAGDVIYLFDFKTGELLDIGGGHTQAVFALAISDDNKMVASGGGTQDGTVIFHEIVNRKLVNRSAQKMSDGMVRGLDFVPGTHEVAAVDETGIVARIRPGKFSATGEMTEKPSFAIVGQSLGRMLNRNMLREFYGVRVTSDAQYIVALLNKAIVYKADYNMASGGGASGGLGPSTPVTSSDLPRAIDVFGKLDLIVEAHAANAYLVFPNDTTKKMQVLAAHNDRVTDVRFSPDGKRLATIGGKNFELIVWDLAGPEPKIIRRITGSDKSPAFASLGTDNANPWQLIVTRKEGSSEVRKAFDIRYFRFNDDYKGNFTTSTIYAGAGVFPKHDAGMLSIVVGQPKVALKRGSTHVVGGGYGAYVLNSSNKIDRVIGSAGIPANGITELAGGRFVAIGYDDGKVEFYTGDSYQYLGALIVTPEWEWAFVTENGYYMASLGGARNLGWKINPWHYENKQAFEALKTYDERLNLIKEQVAVTKRVRFFPVEQFDLRLNRPDLVLQTFADSGEELFNAYYAAYLKRVKKAGFDGKTWPSITEMPEIQLAQLPQQTSTEKINLNIKAEGKGTGLKTIQVWINNVPVFGKSGKSIAGNVTSYAETIPVTLSSGINRIQVAVVNTAGVESLKETAFITNVKPAAAPQIYVLAIGVSEFSEAGLNLNYAAKDATDLAKFFENKAAGRVKTKVILNRNVTRQAVLDAKNWLKTAGPDDIVVISVATHGLLDEKLDYYLATTNIATENPAGAGLAYDDFESIFDGLTARKKLVLIDACHSGEVDKTEPFALADASMQGGVQARAILKSKGGPKPVLTDGLGLRRSVDLVRELFLDIRKSTGAVVVSSAGGQEYALESDAWKNGVFTYSVLSGLQEAKADVNKDGRIMVSELRAWVLQEVPRLTGGRQTPTTRNDNLEFDFELW